MGRKSGMSVENYFKHLTGGCESINLSSSSRVRERLAAACAEKAKAKQFTLTRKNLIRIYRAYQQKSHKVAWHSIRDEHMLPPFKMNRFVGREREWARAKRKEDQRASVDMFVDCLAYLWSPKAATHRDFIKSKRFFYFRRARIYFFTLRRCEKNWFP